jgi:hypothetical protein
MQIRSVAEEATKLRIAIRSGDVAKWTISSVIDALYGDMSPCCSPGDAPRYGGRRPSLEKGGIGGTPATIHESVTPARIRAEISPRVHEYVRPQVPGCSAQARPTAALSSKSVACLI